jgi:hypothetical protein
MAVDLNAIKAEYNRLESTGQSNFLDNFVPMPEGEGIVALRLLPPKSGVLPFVATRTHKMNNKNFHCPCTLINNKWQGSCPICNYYRSLWKQADNSSKEEAEALQAEARGIKPIERYYWNAMVRTLTNKQGVQEHNVGPKIFSCGKQLQSKLLRAMTGDEAVELEGLGDITDLEEGRDLRVIKRLVKGGGDEKYPNYNESVFLNPSVAGNAEEVEQWLANRHDLESLRRIVPQEELAKEVRIHRGLEQDPDTAYSNVNEEGANDEPIIQPVKPIQARPAATAQVQRPPVAKKPAPLVDDADEAMADEDFLSKLKNM